MLAASNQTGDVFGTPGRFLLSFANRGASGSSSLPCSDQSKARFCHPQPWVYQKRTGAEDSMTLRVDFVCRALAKWKSQVPPQTFLALFSSYIFRQQFDQVLTALGLSEWGFRPYSLRRGGATMYFQKHPSFDSVRQLGRWGSDRTARIYINDGVALRLLLTFRVLC